MNTGKYDIDTYMERCRLQVEMVNALGRAMKAAKVDFNGLAKRANLLHEYVFDILSGELPLSIDMFAKLGLACGVRWKLVGVADNNSKKVVVKRK